VISDDLDLACGNLKSCIEPQNLKKKIDCAIAMTTKVTAEQKGYPVLLQKDAQP